MGGFLDSGAESSIVVFLCPTWYTLVIETSGVSDEAFKPPSPNAPTACFDAPRKVPKNTIVFVCKLFFKVFFGRGSSLSFSFSLSRALTLAP